MFRLGLMMADRLRAGRRTRQRFTGTNRKITSRSKMRDRPLWPCALLQLHGRSSRSMGRSIQQSVQFVMQPLMPRRFVHGVVRARWCPSVSSTTARTSIKRSVNRHSRVPVATAPELAPHR